jgi:AraC family transcriptional regulator
MSRAASPLNRFLINPNYSIFYRKAKKLIWPEQVRPEHSVLFVLGGILTFEVGGLRDQAQMGHILLVGPSQPFSASGTGVETLLITLSSQFMIDYAVRMRLVGPTGNVGFSITRLKKEHRLEDLSRELMAELVAENAGSEIVIAAVVEQIVVHLLRNFCNMRRSEELELSRVGLIDRRIRRAVELMQAQLHRELSLKEIAAASFLSPFHFARLFKKLTGASPHAYLATLRTKQAQILLAESDLSITEISSRVGYSNSSHFTQAFRQMTGLTPRAFRKALMSRDSR